MLNPSPKLHAILPQVHMVSWYLKVLDYVVCGRLTEIGTPSTQLWEVNRAGVGIFRNAAVLRSPILL